MAGGFGLEALHMFGVEEELQADMKDEDFVDP